MFREHLKLGEATLLGSEIPRRYIKKYSIFVFIPPRPSNTFHIQKRYRSAKGLCCDLINRPQERQALVTAQSWLRRSTQIPRTPCIRDNISSKNSGTSGLAHLQGSMPYWRNVWRIDIPLRQTPTISVAPTRAIRSPAGAEPVYTYQVRAREYPLLTYSGRLGF